MIILLFRLITYETFTKPKITIIITDVPVSEFTQSDLAANNVMYIHTSTDEIYTDSFTFSVSDGSHEVIRKFSISISPVDDSIPVVISNGLKVQEGVRKIITEFDLKATDKDTKVSRMFCHK